MKKCTYCGKEYPDEASSCPLDDQSLEDLPSPNLTTPQPVASQSPPPAIWNPNAAACWSLVFSPAFGALLHAYNAESLGRADEAKANRAWFYGSLAYAGFALISIFIPAIPDSLFRSASLGILLAWYLSLGKKQVDFVKATWEGRYQRKGWGKPLLIAFGCLVGFLLAVFILAAVAESFSGRE